MFERFTDRARDTVVGAQDVARELRHRPIGTEHLLLGLLAQEQGIAAKVLTQAGVHLADVRAAVEANGWPSARGVDTGAALQSIGIDLDEITRRAEESFGPGALRRTRAGGRALRGHVPFSPRAKKVLELSLREALALKHSCIGTEHILLGLLREGQGLACQIIGERLDHARARDAILGMLRPAGGR